MIYSQSYVAIPPAETIKEQLSLNNINLKDFTVQMGLSENHIFNLLEGNIPITSDVAMKLESVLGIPSYFWLNLESMYQQALVKVNKENQHHLKQRIS